MSRSLLSRRLPSLALLPAAALIAPIALAGPAAAADPVTINVLTINDFHGRIDANTVKFAGTIEQLRAEGGADSTLLLSAGDNIGASLFPSAVARDVPTLDVLDALDVKASAVGNHEFDQGANDLFTRVVPQVDFPILGANVLKDGQPALPAYSITEIQGVPVAIIGAVTQETSSLVSPGGIQGITFTDPVQAVNDTVAVIKALPNAPEVIIADYHEGGPDAGTTPLADALAGSAIFRHLVNDTSPEVDAIINGHTHEPYAYAAPVPGEPERTRPVVQTGAYGANVGQMSLTIDPATGDVSTSTARVVPRTTADDASLISTYPRVAEVNRITQAALANAATVGNEPKGRITADITTAINNGVRDDRASESTLGGLVADALLAKAGATTAGADLAIVNPGGLRADLRFAGTGGTNTDGVVTYAEANAVLPFVNNVSSVAVSGATLKKIFEQQWQRDAIGAVPSRPYLQLGTSKNVRYTFDPARPEGDRITSLWINDKPLDPAATYKVATFSFLATGGDNFRAFTEGVNTDTGLVDYEAWISYLEQNQPLSPDFARRSVQIAGPAAAPVAGGTLDLTVSKLDLTSAGTPPTTSLKVELVQGSTVTKLGDVSVTGGSATISLPLPARVSGAAVVRLTGTPTGTVATLPVTIGAAPVDHLVISEAYLNGGSAGASVLNKFVEIFNPTSAPVDVDGWSVQYRSATGTGSFSGVIKLGDHTIPAGGRLLVSGNSNGSVGTPLPTPDVTSAISFSGSTGGTLALVKKEQALTGTPATVRADADLVDLVGYGTSNTFEGSAAASGYSVTASLNRAVSGADTDDNATDFTAAAPTPQACGAACDGSAPTPAVSVKIPEIQGTGATSPLAGRTVITRGIVTAAYPSGGLSGAYIQTPGTGGANRPSDAPSDGLFVFSASLAAGVKVGDYVEITGEVSEFAGLTEVTPQATDGWKILTETAAAVTPTPADLAVDDAGRERLEGMLVAPQGPATVTDNNETASFGEIGLALDDEPLRSPTDVARPKSAAYDERVTFNRQHLITVDDGASINFFGGSGRDVPLPWLTATNEVRVGAPVTFTAPFVLDYRNSLWKLQPTAQVVAGGPEPLTIGSTRTAAPAPVGGSLKIATFNVLNYFTTTGREYEASGVGSCTYFSDRGGDPVTVNRCTGTGPRGAADDEDLARQQAKIVDAISALGADVIGLEEIENSRSLGLPRDTALADLVTALNAKDGAGTWDYVRSPAQLPASEDVIRTAFIYRVAKATPQGASVIFDDPAFDNAREPLAQVFRPVGGRPVDDLLVVANHFKSKSSGEGADADQGDGQSASNASRVKQATALVTFVKDRTAAVGTDQVFLVGDFNSYGQEDPLQVLRDAGYVDVTAKDSPTYVFDGQVGSLDHVFASPSAAAKVTGSATWDINADESVAREYSRINSNVTNLYAAGPYRASDHDPTIVGVDAISKVPPAPQPSALCRAIARATDQTARFFERIGLRGVAAVIRATGAATLRLFGCPPNS